MEERQIMEEFDKVQKQLIEDLRQQLDSKYSQEMEGLYGNEQMQTNEEIRSIAKPTTRALRKEGHEASAPREPLICWRCSETGHKKKDCVKPHVVSRCRQPVKENCNYCSRMGHMIENFLYRRIDSYKQNNVKPYSSSRSRMPTLVGHQQTDRLRDISQRKYEEQTGTKWLPGIPETEGGKASVVTAYEWSQPQLGKESTHQFNI